MASKTEFKRKSVRIYDIDEFEKLINGVQVASCMLTEPPQVVDEQSVIKRVNALTLSGATSGDRCSCCNAGPFQSRQQQIAHYKHHWHTHNLKRRLFGKPPLTLGQFNSRQDDNSSVSGSDSETEGATNTTSPDSELFVLATRHCKAFFTNTSGQVFCVYRCLLHHRKEDLSRQGTGHPWAERCKSLANIGSHRWAVLMVSGGHFAGAVFVSGVAAVHKTHRSYVVRRGQGQAQGTRDQQGNAPKGAGASLRRYNQAKFLTHVQEVLNSWSEDLAGCSLILYRAVGPLNQAALFGKAGPIRRDDPRVRSLPFPTRKPTFKEVQRAHATLANVEVYDTLEQFQTALLASCKPAAKHSSDSSSDRGRKTKASPGKPVDRAKSREPAARELPTEVMSSEDEGPCFIDSETPENWIKTLSEQNKTGIISDSRKDLLNDYSVGSPEYSDSEEETLQEKKPPQGKKKKKKKPEEDKKEPQKNAKSVPKVPGEAKEIWKAISSSSIEILQRILSRLGEQQTSVVNAIEKSTGDSALHKAARANNPDLVTLLLRSGADPCVRNHQQQTAYAAATQAETRVAFRMYQAEFPEQHNYAKSQIPGPLTPELLEEERQRKAAQKKAKRQRDKERQIEKNKMNQFIQLTDEQKAKTGDQRCFLCGAQLPKIPFDYDCYKFCRITCLQRHRQVRPLNMTV